METIEQLESMGSSVHSSIAVAWLCFAAWSAGVGLRQVLRCTVETRSDLEIAFAVAGLYSIGVLAICLGSLGYMNGKLPLWLLGVISVFGLIECYRRWSTAVKNYTHAVNATMPKVRSLPRYLNQGMIFAVAIFTLGPALNFPTGWDELVYHCVLPRRWAETGWPAFYEDIPYSAFPSLAEILAWMLAPIEALVTTRLLGWVNWFASCYLAYSAICMITERKTALCVAISFAGNPTSLMVSQNGYVESFLMLNCSAMLVLLLATRNGDIKFASQGGTAILLGIFVGGAAATKLTGTALMAVPLCWLLWMIASRPQITGTQTTHRHRQQRPSTKSNSLDTDGKGVWKAQRAQGEHSKSVQFKQAVHASLISALVAGAVAAPFYLRPWWLSGNPFYPYFGSWFSTNLAIIECSNYHHAIGGGVFGMRGPIAWMATPILLAWDQALFDGSFGLQWLVMLCLIACGTMHARKKRSNILLVKTSQRRTKGESTQAIGMPEGQSSWSYAFMSGALVLYVSWYCTAQQARFALPVVIIVAILAAWGIDVLETRWKTLARTLLLIATIYSLPWTTAGYYFAAWETIAGIWSPTQWVRDSLDSEYVPLVSAIDQTTPKEATILMLLEHRTLYIARRCMIGTPFFQARGFTPPEKFATHDAFRKYVEQTAITHVVVANRPVGPDRASTWWNRLGPMYESLQREIDSGFLKSVWASNTYALLAIDVSAPATNQSTSSTKVSASSSPAPQGK